ncbi:MAG: RNA methyltransferase [Treponema sp.]|jgi:RsmE family RNA methyltransferase|nr:RNA methyltransferase [Treponema sp.]
MDCIFCLSLQALARTLAIGYALVSKMNIILFEPEEAGKPLGRRDERTTHLLKVLHKKAGDTFDAGLLGGSLGTGTIETVRLDGSIVCSLRLGEEPPPRAPISLALGFPRPIQLRRILRDLSNLGIEAIDILASDLGEKSYRDTRLLEDGGSRAALIEGAVQARDTRLPDLRVFPSLDAWLAERPWERSRAAATPGRLSRKAFGYAPLLIAADNLRPEGSLVNIAAAPGQPMALAVGSERGWSDRERDLLEGAGFLRLSMGNRALRTETACVAAAVLALEKTGLLS